MNEPLSKEVDRPHREAVDRLIELASYGRPSEKEIDKAVEKANLLRANTQAPLEIPDPEEEPQKLPSHSMWKSLGQLKTLLPLAAKLLPLLEIGGVRLHAPTSVSIPKELTHGVTELQSGHRELQRTMQDQTIELKRLDEQLTRIRATVEKNAREYSEFAENLTSIRTLTLTIGGTLGVLLIALIVLVSLLLAHQ